ncbi:hypothetical protein, partial [Bradymonas sediminis]|uniref:hypothetical protein n=1 Tax=Bradymonas sediminis TaxID=1548548 RepID=UPI0010D7FFC2
PVHTTSYQRFPWLISPIRSLLRRFRLNRTRVILLEKYPEISRYFYRQGQVELGKLYAQRPQRGE